MMFKTIISKILQMMIILFVITTLTFILMKLSPGNPVNKILHLDTTQVSQYQIQATEQKLGLNDSIFVQWWHWMSHLLHFNLGTSFQTNEPVTQEIAGYIGPTLIITFGTLIVSMIISIPLGIFAALNYHKTLDHLIRIFTSLSVSLPSFFIGLILLFIFNQKLNLLPTSEEGSIAIYVLPILTMSIGMCAYYIRLIRSNLLEQYQSPIVEASRLRGMSERYILFNDIFKPSLLPIIPLLGLSVGSLIGGTVVIENLFDIPGLGYILVDSIKSRDYPLIQGCVLFIGCFVVIINMIADILSLMMDPKQRYNSKDGINIFKSSRQSQHRQEGDRHEA